MNEWIKVSDKYPPVEIPILCYLDYEQTEKKETEEIKTHIKKIVVAKIKENSCWLISDNWMYYIICCTHWMRLPEQPNE